MIQGWGAIRLALAAGILAATGCHTFRFNVSSAPFDPTPIVDRKTYWLFGWFPEHDVDVRTICPDGVSVIEESTAFTDFLFTALTLEIYTPRTSSYNCRLPQGPTMPGGVTP